MSPIAELIINLLQLFNLLLLIWCVCSWFPAINWGSQPFKLLDDIVRPVIAPFRKIIPPVGNIDFSPIVAIICIQWIGGILVKVLQ